MSLEQRNFNEVTDFGSPGRRLSRMVGVWLFGLCFMIWVMVTLGGATRLTGSGLSIMEWAPLSGALPPWSDTEWQRLFALYQKIPQYELLNKGFGIDGFRRIFWLEWAHRLWGRLIGLALILPLLWFLWRRTLPGSWSHPDLTQTAPPFHPTGWLSTSGWHCHCTQPCYGRPWMSGVCRHRAHIPVFCAAWRLCQQPWSR